MHSLNHARIRAREVRTTIKISSSAIPVSDLIQYCQSHHKVAYLPVEPATLGGLRAEVRKLEGYIKIDKTLDPITELATLAHEIGHLELHAARLNDRSAVINPIMASVYADQDRAGLARYNRRMCEEVEAEAFAMELLCPALSALTYWTNTSGASVVVVAQEFCVDMDLARTQLASGLYLCAMGETPAPQTSVLPEPDGNQRDAIVHWGSHALVDAGPGTGKTATLAHRVRFLIEEQHINPEHILVLTFSNEAAEELRRRIAIAIGVQKVGAITIETFHAFGFELVHVYYAALGMQENFSLLDDDAQLDLVSRLLGQREFRMLVNLKDIEGSAEGLVRLLNHCSGRMVSCDELETQIAGWTEEDGDSSARDRAVAVAALYRAYQAEKRNTNSIDFNDLIWLPFEILTKHEAELSKVRATHRHILVDEFQDVTTATSRLLALLAGADQPVWVVGDARQSIYRFLGASPENVSRFERTFPDAKRYELRTNYRAASGIVDAANELATLLEQPEATSVERRWEPHGGRASTADGAPAVRIAIADTDGDEVRNVVEAVIDAIARKVLPDEIAVLARRNEDVRRIAIALAHSGVDVSANNLLSADGAAGDLIAMCSLPDDRGSTAAVRLLIALGRTSLDVSDLNQLIESMLRGQDLRAVGIGNAVIDQFDEVTRLAGEVKESADAFGLLTTLLFDSVSLLRPLVAAELNAVTRLRLSEFASVLALAVAYRATSRTESPYEARIRFGMHARRKLAKGQPAPVAPPNQQGAVRVMTCHASKGLEFPIVFVVGQTTHRDRESFPDLPKTFRPAVEEGAEQADALLFVAVTRAKHEAVVSSAKRARRGKAVHGDRRIVPLLERWQGLRQEDAAVWSAEESRQEIDTVATPWGWYAPESVNLRAFDTSRCGMQRYLEVIWQFGFPEVDAALYPRFIGSLRQATGNLIGLLAHSGARVERDIAAEQFTKVWPRAELQTHAHHDLYFDTGRELMIELAETFPVGNDTFSFETDAPLALSAGEVFVRLGLIGTLMDASGSKTAIGLSVNSVTKGVKNGQLNWSGLDGDKRTKAALALACKIGGANARLVVSVKDRRAYPHADSRQKASLDTLVDKTVAEVGEFVAGNVSLATSTRECDRCRVRLACPHWLGLISLTKEIS